MPRQAESPPASMVRTRGRTGFGGLAAVALMPPAAFAVHQLRYMLAFGGGAGLELERTGHSYLHSMVPWLVVLLALVAGGFLRSLGRALAGQATLPRYTATLVGLWLACSTTLVAIFVFQELLEGILIAGHPAGWLGIFGYGGWWAIPAALCVGFVLAALLHGARQVVQRVAQSRARPRAIHSGAPQVVARPRDAVLPGFAPLIGGWSDRGPPLIG